MLTRQLVQTHTKIQDLRQECSAQALRCASMECFKERDAWVQLEDMLTVRLEEVRRVSPNVPLPTIDAPYWIQTLLTQEPYYQSFVLDRVLNTYSLADWIVFLGGKVPERQYPGFVLLKKEKDLVVTRQSYSSTPKWELKDEKELRGKLLELAQPADLRIPGPTPLRLEIQMLRANRRRIRVITSYGLKRAGFEETSQCDGGEDRIVFFKNLLREIRKKISHSRTQSKALRAVGGRVTRTLIAGVRFEPGAVLDCMHARRGADLGTNKTPFTSEIHVGIELEFCSKLNMDEIKKLLILLPYKNSLTLKGDGSLRVSHSTHFSHELCILATLDTYKAQVAEICKLLIKNGSYVNKSCGMHVHLDMRMRDAEISFQRLVKCQNILFNLVPSTRRESEYCRRVPLTSDMREIISRNERYLAINPSAYSRHKTLEVRLHSGTLSPRKIVNWIALLNTICDTENFTSFKKLETFQAAFNLPPKTYAYMQERTEKFLEEGIDEDPEHIPSTGLRGRASVDSDDPFTTVEPDFDRQVRGCGCSACASAHTRMGARDTQRYEIPTRHIYTPEELDAA